MINAPHVSLFQLDFPLDFTEGFFVGSMVGLVASFVIFALSSTLSGWFERKFARLS